MLLDVVHEMLHGLVLDAVVEQAETQWQRVGSLGVNLDNVPGLHSLGSRHESGRNIRRHSNPVITHEPGIERLLDILVELGIFAAVVSASYGRGQLRHHPRVVGVVGRVGQPGVGAL